MSRRAPRLALLLAAFAGSSVGCFFFGAGTLGAFCESDEQCGAGQGCFDSICGSCGDAEVQAGEFCFDSASSEQLGLNAGEELVGTLRTKLGEQATTGLVSIVNEPCEGQPDATCVRLWILLPELDGPGYQAAKLPSQDPGEVRAFTLTDFDGDELPDVVLAIEPLDAIDNMSRVGIGLDFPEGPIIDIDVSLEAKSIAVADLDGDGRLDLLTSAESTNVFSVLLGTGSDAIGPTFGPEQLLVTVPAPRLAPPVDMDNDGDLDVIVASATDKTLGIDLNDGTGKFTPGPRFDVPGFEFEFVTAAELDGDGNGDVILLTDRGGDDPLKTQPAAFILPGSGDGQLGQPIALAGLDRPTFALAHDVNADGLLDLLITDAGEDLLSVFINREGEFPDRVTLAVPTNARTLLLGDVDDDDDDDLVITHSGGLISIVLADP